MPFKPNVWPCQCPGQPGPGCACTTTKPPSASAPAAASANRFLFIVGFICCYKASFAPLKDMTERAVERLQNFSKRDNPKPQVLGTSTSTREVVTKAQPSLSWLTVWMRSRSHG